MSSETPPIAYIAWGLARDERWQPPQPRWRLSVALLLTTLATTTVVGARLYYNFNLGVPAYRGGDDFFPFLWAWRHPGLVAAGLPFSLAVMAILLGHELGHYLACRYYRMDCSYPMFLPAPTLIGTMGAVIRIKSPFFNRRELFDIGVAGPLAGFALTVPLLLYGLGQSHVIGAAQWGAWQGQQLEFGWPPLAQWVAGWMYPGTESGRVALSPLARAAWLGMLVTMLNLLPAAQLDGGHMLYAFSPKLHRVFSWAMMAGLVAAGWWYWPGWYVWATFIAIMRARHPFVPPEGKLGAVRIGLAVAAIAIFVLTFMAMPFRG